MAEETVNANVNDQSFDEEGSSTLQEIIVESGESSHDEIIKTYVFV